VGRPPAIELATGVWRIPTAPRDLVNAYALVDDDGQVTLVDCGTKWAPRRILAALAHVGSGAVDVTRIVATHGHADHVGGLATLRHRTGATVAVHEGDAQYVREGRTPKPAGTWLSRFMPELRVPPSRVDQELRDGDVLPVAGGLRVVATPGHTPGHVSLLHERSRVLITGDALCSWTGRITYAPRLLCTDAPLTRRTAHVLGELDYTTAAFTHGPEIRTNAREAVRGFLSRRRTSR